MDFPTSHIDLSNVEAISRGDPQRMKKYILQFQELIPERLLLLKEALQTKNRVQIRQITHKMIPQLQFFGVREISVPISRLEYEYMSMSMEELEGIVSHIISTLERALDEVSKILKERFD
ncbi:hypothetical protein DFQ04_2946 [Algoriphagus boseongensis]|uniref:HPt domain-containing protein n=2 Tax=Algoriphagus boseongensis TaxID=1442587 RepID=A0A4R6T1I1_9BACT|nr:hypothetical protein DFQ04_2946 [Algoriphagus boseongensis]